MTRALLLLCTVLALAGCSKPRQPDWLVNADGAQDRFERAYLSADDRVAASEFVRFRSAVTSTAQPGLVARAELTRCAVQVASLEFQGCPGFEVLRDIAPAREQAYADFLAGRVRPEQAELLPKAYQAVASGTADAAAVEKIEDPLSRVLAAAVLLRMQRADARVLEIATDTASGQGWRRAVLAWLAAQVVQAERTGQEALARTLRRRMELARQQR